METQGRERCGLGPLGVAGPAPRSGGWRLCSTSPTGCCSCSVAGPAPRSGGWRLAREVVTPGTVQRLSQAPLPDQGDGDCRVFSAWANMSPRSQAPLPDQGDGDASGPLRYTASLKVAGPAPRSGGWRHGLLGREHLVLTLGRRPRSPIRGMETSSPGHRKRPGSLSQAPLPDQGDGDLASLEVEQHQPVQRRRPRSPIRGMETAMVSTFFGAVVGSSQAPLPDQGDGDMATEALMGSPSPRSSQAPLPDQGDGDYRRAMYCCTALIGRRPRSDPPLVSRTTASTRPPHESRQSSSRPPTATPLAHSSGLLLRCAPSGGPH